MKHCACAKVQKNIAYKTNRISEYFNVNRVTWDQFYPSEKWMLERVAGPKGEMGRVLDGGCAAGGLGLALGGRFRGTWNRY